jgi:hypothetical protein
MAPAATALAGRRTDVSRTDAGIDKIRQPHIATNSEHILHEK